MRHRRHPLFDGHVRTDEPNGPDGQIHVGLGMLLEDFGEDLLDLFTPLRRLAFFADDLSLHYVELRDRLRVARVIRLGKCRALIVPPSGGIAPQFRPKPLLRRGNRGTRYPILSKPVSCPQILPIKACGIWRTIRVASAFNSGRRLGVIPAVWAGSGRQQAVAESENFQCTSTNRGRFAPI